MQRWQLLILASIIAAAAAADRGAAQGLAHTLEVRVTQSGFAGETGRLWTIQPNGRWVMKPVGPGGPQNAAASGSLTEAQLTDLRRLLDGPDFQSLPKSAGANVLVNPHRVVIRWGEKEVVLTSPPGKDPLAAGRQISGATTDEQRIAAMARKVQSLTTDQMP